MNVYGDNSSSLNISATIRIPPSFTTTNFLANTSTSYAASNWQTHLDSSQNTAGRIYLMEFTVRSTTSSPTQTVSQWVNVYAKSTGQTQSEGYKGGYIRFYIQESTEWWRRNSTTTRWRFPVENKKYIYKKMYKANRNSGLENICKEISSWCVDSVQTTPFSESFNNFEVEINDNVPTIYWETNVSSSQQFRLMITSSLSATW